MNQAKGKSNNGEWNLKEINRPDGIVKRKLMQRTFNLAKKFYGEPLKGKKVLDVGCGGGIEAEWLAREGAIVTALDDSEDYLYVARLRAKIKRFNAKFVKADAHKLPFKDKSFDIVVFCGTLHHLCVRKAISEAVRVGKAIMIIYEPCGSLLVRYLKAKINWSTEYENQRIVFLDRYNIEHTLMKYHKFRTIKYDCKFNYFPKTLDAFRDSNLMSLIWLPLIDFLSWFKFLCHEMILVAR